MACLKTCFISPLQYYDDKVKTCVVIFLNYLFHDCGGTVDPRTGAQKDSQRLEKLFEHMGIDEDSILICQEYPYKVSFPHLCRVFKYNQVITPPVLPLGTAKIVE